MENTQLKIGNYSGGGSRSFLKNLLGKKFTITNVADSKYNEDEGVDVTTKEEFDYNGNKYNLFFTSWKGVVNQLSDSKLRTELSNGKALGPLKIVTKVSQKTKKSYYALEDA